MRMNILFVSNRRKLEAAGAPLPEHQSDIKDFVDANREGVTAEMAPHVWEDLYIQTFGHLCTSLHDAAEAAMDHFDVEAGYLCHIGDRMDQGKARTEVQVLKNIVGEVSSMLNFSSEYLNAFQRHAEAGYGRDGGDPPRLS